MDWSAIIAAAEKVAGVVEELAPLGAVAGPEGAVIGKLVGGVAQAASDALANATDEAAVISAKDLASVQAIQAKIEAANDLLGQQIDAS